MFELNPTAQKVRAIIESSKHKSARTLTDEETGDVWVWPFEFATHHEAAALLKVKYSRPVGDGDVLVI